MPIKPPHESTSHEPLPAGGRSIDWRLVAKYSVRLAWIAAVAWLAVWMLVILSHWQDAPKSHADEHPVATDQPLIPLQLADFLDGHWSFGESGSETGIARIRDEQLEARLMALPFPPTAAGGTAPTQSPPAADRHDRELLDWLRSLDAKPEVRDGYQVYRYSGPALRGAAFVNLQDGTEHVQVVRLATDDGQGGWLLIENRTATAAAAMPTDQGTLPLAPSAKREGTRRDRQGRVVSEMVSFQGDFAPIRRFWEQQGWKVEQIDSAKDATRRLRCQRGGLAWHVWVRQEAAAGTLLIVLEPAG